MKKLWLFPMIFFLLILLAGHLRWEKGPLQHTDAYQVQHTKDQWTGQRWIILYGGMAEEAPSQVTDRILYIVASGFPILPGRSLICGWKRC